MSVQNYLNKNYGDKIFTYPNIPIEKFNNARKKYAGRVDVRDSVLLIDDTVFGSAECGVLITNEDIYIGESFESPMHFSMHNIHSIYTKRVMFSNWLFINDKKVKSFTQPSFKDLKKVFENLNEYIDYYHSDERRISNELVENKKYLSSVREENETYESIDDDSGDSEYNILNEDGLYNTIQNLETVNKIDSVAYFVLGGENHTNTSDKIRKSLRKYYLKNVLYIRREGLEARGYEYFTNDIALMEALILLSSLLKIELERRGVSQQRVIEIIDLGLMEIFSDGSWEIQYILESSFIDTNFKRIIKNFYIRLALTNIIQNEAYEDANKFNLVVERLASSHEDSMEFVESVNNYIEVVDFNNIHTITKKTVDDILDLIRFM